MSRSVVTALLPWAGGLALLCALVLGGARPAAADDNKPVPAVCKDLGKDTGTGHHKAKASKGGDEDDDDDDDEGVRFDLAGACAKLTGSVSYTYQQAQKSASGLPVFVNPNGTVSRGTSANTVSADAGIEIRRKTALGEFKTTFGAGWSKATGDDTQNGSFEVNGWSVGLAGFTVGYINTLMNFWEGDFLSTVNAPGRTANAVTYEYKIDAANTIAAGIESALPTEPDTDSGIKSFDFSEPVYTLRWRYETDPLTLHLSGLVRRADFTDSPLLPLFPDTATVRTGWAVSAGAKVALPFIHDDDEATVQATYASDASSYLGINVDTTTYQHTIRSLGPTTGWSAVASYHHVWSDEFESNAFASYVKIDGDFLLGKPQAQSLRTGVNLFWKPVDHLKFGAELGTVDI
ncbi:MAG: hypothetical protein ACTHLO_17735, partial [Pseudolabrys sp.]